MSWQNDDLQDIIAQAQQAKMIRQNDEMLEELKKQGASRESVSSEPTEKTYKCPACAEWIKAEAKICKHCRTEVGEIFGQKIAEEKRAEAKKQKELENRRAKAEFEKLAQERAEKERLDALNSQYSKEREANKRDRAERIEKVKRLATSKTGVVLAGLLTICIIVYFLMSNNAKIENVSILKSQKNSSCSAFFKVLTVLENPKLYSNDQLVVAKDDFRKSIAALDRDRIDKGESDFDNDPNGLGMHIEASFRYLYLSYGHLFFGTNILHWQKAMQDSIIRGDINKTKVLCSYWIED